MARNHASRVSLSLAVMSQTAKPCFISQENCFVDLQSYPGGGVGVEDHLAAQKLCLQVATEMETSTAQLMERKVEQRMSSLYSPESVADVNATER